MSEREKEPVDMEALRFLRDNMHLDSTKGGSVIGYVSIEGPMVKRAMVALDQMLRAPVDPPERVSEQEPGWYRRVNVQQVSDASALRSRLLTAALGYIDVCPCDPDITAEQWKAWQEFEAARRALEGAKGEG